MAYMLNILGVQWAVHLSNSQKFRKWGQELSLFKEKIEDKLEPQVEK
jgi:hypothetical protein